MNSLLIPPSPNWYEISILACAPDNTLIYGARNDIVVIHDSPSDQPANIKIISRAHSQKVISTNINKNWGQPHKLLVTVAEDKIIKLWNVETMERKLAHKEHVNHNRVIGATFAGDERIISVSEDGIIIVWNTSLNQTNILRDVFGFKVTITCISTCPHATWLTAFGLKNGLVVVTDLRKEGRVLYKLRGHDKSVLSLSWCPAPINIFPKDPHNYVGAKKVSTIITNGSAETAEGTQTVIESNKDTISINGDFKDVASKQSDNENDSSFNIVNSNITSKESNKKYDKSTLWTGLKHADDDDLPQDFTESGRTHPLLKVYDSGDEDFLKECHDLKTKILGTSPPELPDASIVEEKPRKLVLKAKKWHRHGKKTQKQDRKSDKIKDKDSVKEACLEQIIVAKTEIHEHKETSVCNFAKDATSVLEQVSENSLAEPTESGIREECELAVSKEPKDDQGLVQATGENVESEYKEKSTTIAKSIGTQYMDPIDDEVIEAVSDIKETIMTKISSEDTAKGSIVEGLSPRDVVPPDITAPKDFPETQSDETLAASTVPESMSDSIQDKSIMEEISSAEVVDDVPPGEVQIETPIISPAVLAESICEAEGIKVVSLTQDNSEVHSDEIREKTLADSKVLSDGSDSKEVLLNQDVQREIPKIEPVEEEPRKEFLLASSAREGNIYIWRAGTDGRMQTFLTVPNKPNHRKAARSNADKVWIILCWATPTMLLSSSKSAELIQWNLPKPKEKGKQFRLIHNDHNSIMFSIAAPIVLLNEYNWLEEKKLNAWTVGQNRLLLNTSLASERTNLACYPTLGRAECFALSPLDPNRLAIGTADGVIKIWDLSRPHTKSIVMYSFFQKIQSKVATLAWHPTSELILAYGTLEGRVGYMDTNNKSKSPTLLPNFFKSQIHKIEWGPINGNKEEVGLFVVAEGKLVMFSTQKSEKEPQELDTPDNTYVYTFAWKPDYSILLVSTKAGSVITYSTDLQILSTQYFQQKVQQIYWHPEAIQSDPNVSKYCYWFAAVSNSKDLFVYNFGIKADSSEDKIVSKYEGLGDIINCVSWSSFTPIELVVARDDGIAQVWNVESNLVLSTYMNPNFEGLLAVIWSPLDSNYIISAGKDHTVQIWKTSDFPGKNEKEIADIRKASVKEISSECALLLPKAEKVQEETVKTKKSKNNLLPRFYVVKDTSQIILDLRRLLLWKEGLNAPEIGDGDHNHNILNIFGSSADMLKIIDLNETIHKEKGKYNLQNTLSLFKGDISTTIKEAIDEKRVNPWVIMMAPMVSPKLWQAACEVYAQQLSVESDSDPLEVATYYLMCHKIQEAIDTLCEGAMFREALALAKCRLLANDPVVTTIIEKWAKHSLIVGNFEIAAQCNIFLGKYEEAASVLFRRSDVKILKFAMELAEKSGNEELYKAVLFRYNSYNKENTVSETEEKLPSKAEALLQKLQAEKNIELFQKTGSEHENGDPVQHIKELREDDEPVLFDTNTVRLDSTSKETYNEGRIAPVEGPDIVDIENGEYITTEDTKILASNSKVELLNNNSEIESVNFNEYSGDK